MPTTLSVRADFAVQTCCWLSCATAVLLAVGGCSATGGSAGENVESCVAPVFGTTHDPQPLGPGRWPSLGAVAQGHPLTVDGRSYFDGPCRDTATGAVVPSARPETAVVLSLRTSDGASIELATVQPGKDAGFTATLRVPSDAPTGPARITDGQGHVIKLVIVNG